MEQKFNMLTKTKDFVMNINKANKRKYYKSNNIPLLTVNENVGFEYRESFNMLAQNVLYSILKTDCKTILITAASMNSGKTNVSINLGTALANLDKKVLIIDSDIFNPSVAKYLEIEFNDKFKDVIFNNNDIKECIVRDKLNHFDVISISQSLNLHKLLLSQEFRDIVNRLKATYDWIIFDSPMITDFAFVSEINNLVDGSILVINKKTGNVKHIKKALLMLGEKCIGSVINFVDSKYKKYYGNYYNNEYVSSYTKDSIKSQDQDKE